MEIYRIIGALIEGVLFALLMWIGDEFILKNDNALYVYAIQAIIFAVAMYLFDRFFNRFYVFYDRKMKNVFFFF